MYNIILSMVTALALGFVAMIPLAVSAKSEKAEIDLSPMKLAEFKGDCLRMGGNLRFENNQWSCHAKKKEDGLTPLPIYFPRS